MLAGVKSTLAPAEIRRRRQKLKQAIEAFVQAMVNEAIGWSTANWLIQGLFTSLLSGLGFLFITLALEYIKQYSKEQKKRERARLIHAILNGEEFHDFEKAGAIIPAEKGTVVRPGIRGLTSVFGAYKKYGGFLGIGRGYSADSHLPKVEEEDDDTDHQFIDKHSNTCLDAPTWSNLSLESWKQSQAAKCRSDRSESLQTRSRPYLPHAVFSSAVPSNVRLWSQPSFENEESMSSLKTITKSEGDFFRRLIQKYPYIAPFFKKELLKKIEIKGKKNPEDEQGRKNLGINKGKREKISSDSTTRENNRRYRKGGAFKADSKSEMTLSTCDTDVDKSYGISSSSSRKQRASPKSAPQSHKFNSRTTSPNKVQKVIYSFRAPATLKTSSGSLNLDSKSKDFRKDSSDTCSKTIKKRTSFPAHIAKNTEHNKSTDPRTTDDTTKSSTVQSSVEQSVLMLYLSPRKGKTSARCHSSVEKHMRPVLVSCEHVTSHRDSEHATRVPTAPRDEPPTNTGHGEKPTMDEKLNGCAIMKSLVDITQAPSTIIGADTQNQSDIEVAIANIMSQGCEKTETKLPGRTPSPDVKADNGVGHEMSSEEPVHRKTSPKRGRSPLLKQESKKSSKSRGGTASPGRGKKESPKKTSKTLNEEGRRDVKKRIRSESKNRSSSESKNLSSSESKIRSVSESKRKSNSVPKNPVASKSPKRGVKKSRNEDKTEEGYHLKNTKSNKLKNTHSNHDQHKKTKVTKLHRKNKSSSPAYIKTKSPKMADEMREVTAKDNKASRKAWSRQKPNKQKKPKNEEAVTLAKNEKSPSLQHKPEKRTKSTAARDKTFSSPKLHKSPTKSASEKTLSPGFNAEMYASSIHEVISAEDYDNAINQFLRGKDAERSFKQKHIRPPSDQKLISPPKQGKGASVNTLWKKMSPPLARISSPETSCKPVSSATQQRASPTSSCSQVMSQPTSCMTISRLPVKVSPIGSKGKSSTSPGFTDTSANSPVKKCLANELNAVSAKLPPKNRESRPGKPAEMRKSQKPDQPPVNRSTSYNLHTMGSSDLPKTGREEERLQSGHKKKSQVEIIRPATSPQEKACGEKLWNPKNSVSETGTRNRDPLDGDVKHKTRKYPSEVLTPQRTMGDSDHVIKRQEPSKDSQQKCNIQKTRCDKNKLRMGNFSIRSIESLKKKYETGIQQKGAENESQPKDVRLNGNSEDLIPSKGEQKNVTSVDNMKNVQISSSRARPHFRGAITKSRKNLMVAPPNNKTAGTVSSENFGENVKKLVHETMVSKSHVETISDAGRPREVLTRSDINCQHKAAVSHELVGTRGQLNADHKDSKTRKLSKSPLRNEHPSGHSTERLDQNLFKRRIIKRQVLNRSTTDTQRTRKEKPQKIQAANSSMPELSERSKVDAMPAPKQREHPEFPRMFDRFMALNLTSPQQAHEASDAADKSNGAIATSDNSEGRCRVVSENQSTVNGFESSTAFLSASE
ncbi:unnamed protein product, partial [Lymnaea stagnalis]